MKKEMEAMKKKIHDLESKRPTRTTNITNNNNTVNNNNIVININNFGQEDYSHVTSDFMTNCIKNYMTHGVTAILEHVHLNPNVPQNHNVRIRDIKRKIWELRENNSWVQQHADDAINKLYSHAHKYASRHYHSNIDLQQYDEEKNDMGCCKYIVCTSDKNSFEYRNDIRETNRMVIKHHNTNRIK